MSNKVEVSSHEYKTSARLRRGDEIKRLLGGGTLGGLGWHHGIYLGDGLVSVVVLAASL